MKRKEKNTSKDRYMVCEQNLFFFSQENDRVLKNYLPGNGKFSPMFLSKEIIDKVDEMIFKFLIRIVSFKAAFLKLDMSFP